MTKRPGSCNYLGNFPSLLESLPTEKWLLARQMVRPNTGNMNRAMRVGFERTCEDFTSSTLEVSAYILKVQLLPLYPACDRQNTFHPTTASNQVRRGTQLAHSKHDGQNLPPRSFGYGGQLLGYTTRSTPWTRPSNSHAFPCAPQSHVERRSRYPGYPRCCCRKENA